MTGRGETANRVDRDGWRALRAWVNEGGFHVGCDFMDGFLTASKIVTAGYMSTTHNEAVCSRAAVSICTMV